MTNHYYANKPEVKSNERIWSYVLKDKTFSFVSDNGVFSKNTVDFGSRLLIDTFELSDEAEGNILDVGCGYGPIGLSLAAGYPDRVIEMVDVNERALALAGRNAEINRIENIKVYKSDIYAAVPAEKKFAAIVSNPPIRAGKKVVHAILTEAYQRLTAGGTLSVVIQKKQGAPSAEKKLREVFGNASVLAKDKGYWIIQSIKR